MDTLSQLQPDTRVYDRRMARERVIHQIERHGQVVFLSFRCPQTGAIDRQPFSLTEVENRFEIFSAQDAAFRAQPEIVRLVAEAHRLEHAYLFNPLFATETSLIDLLPHQLAAVYGVPPTPEAPDGRPGMLDRPQLRFLLADDAGAGKTIMAGLVIREMLLRRLVKRVLVVPPAGLVGNWERELRVLFRLRFRILSGADAQDGNPFTDPRSDLAIVSVDTLWRDRMREAYLTAPPYDLVVFDEPTANLDDHRRDNLAEQILNVKGFSQLFVIRHDDSFEQDTDERSRCPITAKPRREVQSSATLQHRGKVAPVVSAADGRYIILPGPSYYHTGLTANLIWATIRCAPNQRRKLNALRPNQKPFE